MVVDGVAQTLVDGGDLRAKVENVLDDEGKGVSELVGEGLGVENVEAGVDGLEARLEDAEELIAGQATKLEVVDALLRGLVVDDGGYGKALCERLLGRSG